MTHKYSGKLTTKGLSLLLAFSFVASIIGFAVAYFENRNYRALTAKYDEAIEKISDLENSVNNIMTTSGQYIVTEEVYTTTQPAEEVTTTQDEYFEYTEDYGSYTQPYSQSYTQSYVPATTQRTTAYTTQYTQPPKEATTKAQSPSATYFVTQSGKKYHVGTCSYLSKSKIAITMDRIQAEGYTPCSRCIK